MSDFEAQCALANLTCAHYFPSFLVHEGDPHFDCFACAVSDNLSCFIISLHLWCMRWTVVVVVVVSSHSNPAHEVDEENLDLCVELRRLTKGCVLLVSHPLALS